VSDEPAVLDPADPRPGVQASLRHWLALQDALALRPGEGTACLRRTPDPRAALAAAGCAPASPERIERAVARLRACGAVALPQTSAAFPPRLARLDDAPLLLLVRGEVALLRAPSVAIVGSRAPSAYGRAVAERFAAGIARAGVAVVSGLATGIDGVAHRAALEAGGPTLAVQACGPDLVYPRRHRELAERIAVRGALVTELAPGTPPKPAHFPFRNRLISALALAVLVVEARVRSGSLVTARHAADQGVDVYAVPGPLGAPTSEGTNELLRDGAYVALEPEDLLRPLGVAEPARRRRARRAGGDPAHRGIVAALREAPATLDELAERLGSAPERLALDVVELELSGAIAEDRDGRLRVVRLEGGGL
jgi:DNA processing protein